MEAKLGSNNPDFNKLFTDTVGIIEQMRVAAQRHGFERMYITIGTHEDVSPGDSMPAASKNNGASLISPITKSSLSQ